MYVPMCQSCLGVSIDLDIIDLSCVRLRLGKMALFGNKSLEEDVGVFHVLSDFECKV